MNIRKKSFISELKIAPVFAMGILSIFIGSFLYSTPASAQSLCNASPEEFATTGFISCGTIRWRLHPQDSARLAGLTPSAPGAPIPMVIAKDMRPYLMKYQQVYDTLKDITGYERPEHELIIEERCGPGASGQCPNGKMLQDVPMYAIGNAIFIRNDFFETTFPFIAGESRTPLSVDLLRQMGRVFTPPLGDTSDGYIWDNALPESFGDIQGVIGTILYSQVNNLSEKFYSDDWCAKQGKGRLCFDFFTTVDQYASIKYDRALQDYAARKDNFDTLFAIPYSTLNVPSSSLTIPINTTIIPSSNLPTQQRSEIFSAMIAQTAKEAREQQLLFSFYDGLRKTLRAYNTYPYVVAQPSSWHQDPTALPLDLKYQKANYFIYLLSSYSRIDFSQSFLKWNFPLVKETKDIILTNVNEASDEPRIPLLGGRILARSFSKLTLASAPRSLTITDPKMTSSLILSWDGPVDVTFNAFSIYRTDTDRGVSSLIAKNIKGNNYTDTALASGRTYYYEVAATDRNGYESSITTRIGKQPSPPIEIKPYEPVFYFYSYGPGKVESMYAEVNWGTTKPASAKIMYATQEGGPFLLLEDNDKKFGGQFKLYNLQPSTTYYYKITAVDATGLVLEQKGTFSTLATPLFAQPASVSYQQSTTAINQIIPNPIALIHSSPIQKPKGVFVKETGTGNSIQVTWKKPSDKKLLTRIYRSTIPLRRGMAFVQLNNSATLWYDNAVEPLTLYTYTIVNVDPASGIESDDVPWTLSISAVPTLGPRTVRVIEKDAANLIQWNVPTYVTSAESVALYRSSVKGQLGSRIAWGLTKNSYLDTPPNGTWYYTVRIITKLTVEGINTDQYAPIRTSLAKQ